jgi:tetratricopeptide (TPR) repeat protein/tRNA A-37 threonylcarbamoyl transferase component Bud32
MSSAIAGDDRSLLRRVDRACDHFEAAWKAGRRPRIEDHLDETPGSDRAALLRELVPLDVSYRRRGGEQPRPEEYRSRFPDHADVIDAAFEPTSPGPADDARTELTRARTAANDNLLFGILALQLDFITRDALIAAMNAWAIEKDKPLGRILVEQGALAEARRVLLEALVREHLKQHGDDPQQSLAALVPLGPVRRDLERVADAEVMASLDHVPTARPAADPFATADPSVGQPTSAGQRFRILRPHAEGGLGTVSVAHDQELNREVALKEIQDRHADRLESRVRFLREAEVTGRLEHPGIVPVYGLGRYADGRPFYAMRLIRGNSLQDELARFHEADIPGRDRGERALALRKLLGRFLDVCDAMAYAHSRGVLHRDLKPRNIMLGKYGETLVVDWGLAKPIDEPVPGAAPQEEPLVLSPGNGAVETLAGAALGTPAYMSPEQAAGELERLGPASDVYSLGATLYALLTGHAPIQGQSARSILDRVRRGEFLPPSRICPGTDRALEAICLKAMASCPEDRYTSARALADDLEHWLADEPVAAYRPPWTWWLARWARRHRAEVQAAAAALLVITLMSAAAAILIRRTQQVETVLASQAALEKARETYERFQKGYGEATFYATQFFDLDPASSRDKTRVAIRSALASLGVSEDGAGSPTLNHDYLIRRREELAARCAELLLLLAEVEAPTPADRSDPEPRDRLQHAVRILDRAARLGGPTWMYHLQRADCLSRLGDEPGAADERRQAARESDRTVDHFHLGMLHLFRGEPAAALPAYERALGLRPDDFWAQYFTAICLLKLGRPAEANAHLTACISRRRDFLWCYLMRGCVLGELGQFEAAEADYRTALGLGPDTQTRYGILVNCGRMRILREQFDEAHADLHEAIRLLPTRYEAYVNRALAFRSQQDWDQAEAQLLRAILLAPDVAAPYRNRARLRIQRGQPAAALEDLDRAIRREAASPRDLAEDDTERGVVLYRAGRYEEAVTAYDAALLAQPSALAHRLRAEAMTELGRDQEAVAALDRCLAFGGSDANAYRLRGLLRKRLGRTAGAVEDLTRALVGGPDSSNVRTKRGWSYLLESRGLALQDFDRAIELNSANSDALTGRGYALVLLGRYEEGVAAAEQAVRLAPDVPDLLYNAACVFAQAVREAKADLGEGDPRSLAARYGERALDLIHNALDLKPAGERAAFWRDVIDSDAALDPIRGVDGFARLEAKYAP